VNVKNHSIPYTGNVPARPLISRYPATCRLNGQWDFGRVLWDDQIPDAVQRLGGAVQPDRPGTRPAIRRVAVHQRRRRPRHADHAVRVDCPVQPVGGGSAGPFPVPRRRGVSIQLVVGPVRDAQRGQTVRGRQRSAIRGAQVLQAAAGATDQSAHRSGGQPGPVQ